MASALAADRLLAAEEFGRTFDPPGMRTELVRGRIIAFTLATTFQGSRAALIDRRLANFASLRRLGLTTGAGGYVLARNPDTVRGEITEGRRGRAGSPPGGTLGMGRERVTLGGG